MDKYLKTKAVVLKRTNYKETDRLVTLFTEDFGKITAIAKGVRKITSTKRGHLELFNLVDIQTAEHKGWHILTQAEGIKTFSNIKENLDLTSYGYYVCEIFEKMVPEEEPNETLFKLLIKTLDYLDKSGNLTVVNAYNLKLLRLLGFYSRSQIKTLVLNMVGYLNKIEMATYEALSLEKFDKQTEVQSHNFLKNFTESVLEKAVKTKLSFSD